MIQHIHNNMSTWYCYDIVSHKNEASYTYTNLLFTYLLTYLLYVQKYKTSKHGIMLLHKQLYYNYT